MLVNGWNVWFYRDLDSLSSVWPGQGRNKQSLGELWIGLLRFYTEQFNINETVVCIRQREMLTRFEKLWTGKCLAVEDPFDLDHNLGAGLSSKMNTFIMKAFHNGRRHFGTSITAFPAQYRSIEDYLFDPKLLTSGPVPAGRNCHRCGCIGHLARDCPQRGEPRKAVTESTGKQGGQQRDTKQQQLEPTQPQQVNRSKATKRKSGENGAAQKQQQQQSSSTDVTESRCFAVDLRSMCLPVFVRSLRV